MVTIHSVPSSGPRSGSGVGVGVAVGVGVGVSVGVGVGVGVAVGVGVGVSVVVGVGVGVGVGDWVAVEVGVEVGVDVTVAVRVEVSVVDIGVGEFVAVGVDVRVEVDVAVLVEVEASVVTSEVVGTLVSVTISLDTFPVLLFNGGANGALAAKVTMSPIRRYPKTPNVAFQVVPDRNPGMFGNLVKIPPRTPLTFSATSIGPTNASKNKTNMTTIRASNTALMVTNLINIS